MGSQFSIINYFLMFVTIISHYPLGRRIIKSKFFTTCLVGLAFSALLVAIFANTFAWLIRPYIVIFILSSLVLLINDCLKLYRKKLFIFEYKIYSLLLIAGFILFSINNPQDTFLKTNHLDQTFLAFDGHQSYFSSQSTEMLNANYFDRIKVSSAYPFEWKPYHFFNSSTQTIVQGLIVKPGLFSYLMAQLLLVIVILLGFGEHFFIKYKFSWINIAAYLFWLLIGFTIFQHSLKWSLTTTQPFSVFAVVSLIFSILAKKYKQSLIFLLVLGISAIRFLPISLISIMLLIIIFYKYHFNNNSPKLFYKENPLLVLFSFLTATYYFFTFFNPSILSDIIKKAGNKLGVFIDKELFSHYYDLTLNNYNYFYFTFIVFCLIAVVFLIRLIKFCFKYYEQSKWKIRKKWISYLSIATIGIYISTIVIRDLIGEPLIIVNAGWYSSLIVYKWFGYLTDFVFGNTAYQNYEIDFINTASLSMLNNYIIILCFSGMIFFTFKKYKSLLKVKTLLIAITKKPIIYGSIILTVIASIVSSNILNLYIIVAIYIVITLVFLDINLSNKLSFNDREKEAIVIYLIALIYATSLILLFKLPEDGLLVPMSYVMFDVFIWALFATILLNINFRKVFIINYLFIMVISFFIGPNFNINHFADSEHNIDVTPLFNNSFQRSDYVNNDNSLKVNFDELVYLDAYASILGATIPYSEKTKNIFRNQWRKK